MSIEESEGKCRQLIKLLIKLMIKLRNLIIKLISLLHVCIKLMLILLKFWKLIGDLLNCVLISHLYLWFWLWLLSLLIWLRVQLSEFGLIERFLQVLEHALNISFFMIINIEKVLQLPFIIFLIYNKKSTKKWSHTAQPQHHTLLPKNPKNSHQFHHSNSCIHYQHYVSYLKLTVMIQKIIY